MARVIEAVSHDKPAGGSAELTDTKAAIRRQVADENVKHVQLWLTDIFGCLRMVELPNEQLDSALENGAPFDGSSIEGYADIESSDIVAVPDWSTFRILPWTRGQSRTAFVICDVLGRDYKPFAGDPRQVLRRQLLRAAELGLDFYVGPELEYFYFKSAAGAELIDDGAYFSILPADFGSELRMKTVSTLKELGVPVEAAHHEVAPSQHEIDPRYDDAMEMADRVMISRFVVREIAGQNGVHATFMPKPLQGENGNGMHVHQSLFRCKTNVFFSPDDSMHLSDVARGFIAGQLHHMPEICSILNQWVNSFKRLLPGYEAPVYISWAPCNRTALIRVPLYVPGKESSLRAEVRNPDPACNPYLAFAVLLAAGLEGIEKGYKLPPAVEPNIYKMCTAEREALGLGRLPANLHEAIAATERGELVRQVLGDHIFTRFIAAKHNDWHEYTEQVSPWETSKLFSAL